MVNEFKNCTDDSSDSGVGWIEGANPTNASDSYAINDDGGDDDRNSDSEQDPEEDPEDESDGDKTQKKRVVAER